GVEKQAKGPIMVFVDCSGSMGGDRIYNAKAIALSLAWLAKTQKRWICLVGFSSGATLEDLPRVVLNPGKWDQVELMEWLEDFDGGGTTCNWLREETMEAMFRETRAPRGKTDVILITDGSVHINDEVVESWHGWKKANQVKLISLVIGGHGGSLEEVSDVTHQISGLGLDQEGVQEALSI
ncbi:unnamed protein product, partial [marine sediment metagenome]